MKKHIKTTKAPQAIGTYSQAISIHNIVYLSGQIPLQPDTMELVQGDIRMQIKQAFRNLQSVVNAAGGDLQDIVKLTVYLLDIHHASIVNEVMQDIFFEPYPARAMIQVSALPKGANVEVEGIMVRI